MSLKENQTHGLYWKWLPRPRSKNNSFHHLAFIVSAFHMHELCCWDAARTVHMYQMFDDADGRKPLQQTNKTEAFSNQRVGSHKVRFASMQQPLTNWWHSLLLPISQPKKLVQGFRQTIQYTLQSWWAEHYINNNTNQDVTSLFCSFIWHGSVLFVSKHYGYVSTKQEV